MKKNQMVFQDPLGSLHVRHTINNVLKEPLEIHNFSDIDDRIKQALNKVGLDSSFRFRYPHQLSGGQRQRVAIGRALILKPGIFYCSTNQHQAGCFSSGRDTQFTDGSAGICQFYLPYGFPCSRCCRAYVQPYFCHEQVKVVEQISEEQLFSNDVQQGYTRQLWIASKEYS
jgi:peptide/nickel transport system ATP-binding protein